MANWINRNKELLIRGAFLIPILAVAAISISHVVSWYNLANPISWAIYLSIAVEVAAMSAIAASSVRVKGFSVWFVFIIVTLIQFIGNIYFSYTEIDVNSIEFKDWAELTFPLFDSFSDTADFVAQRRLLALLEGGLLPLISLTCLHFFIKYGDTDTQVKPDILNDTPTQIEDENLPSKEKVISDDVWKNVARLREEGKLPIHDEEDLVEASALAFTQYEEPLIEDNQEQLIENTEESLIEDNQEQLIEDNQELLFENNVVFIDYPEENINISEKVRIKPGVLPDRSFNKLRRS